jgi:hypothetical protein
VFFYQLWYVWKKIYLNPFASSWHNQGDLTIEKNSYPFTLNRFYLISHKIFDMFIQYLHFHQHVAFSNIILHQPFLGSSRDIKALQRFDLGNKSVMATMHFNIYTTWTSTISFWSKNAKITLKQCWGTQDFWFSTRDTHQTLQAVKSFVA